MAPFKLKFRMGRSRSTSQDAQDNHHIDNSHNRHSTIAGAGIATAVVLSTHLAAGNANRQQQSSLPLVQYSNDNRTTQPSPSLTNSSRSLQAHDSSGNGNHSEQSSLLQSRRSAYTNTVVQEESRNERNVSTVPLSPPPSYEHVLEENRLASLDRDNIPTASRQWMNSSTFTKLNQPNNNYISSSSISSSTSSNDRDLGAVAFRFSTMATPSQEDLLGNLDDGSSEPLFASENTGSNDDEHEHSLNNDNASTHTHHTLSGAGSSASATSTLRRKRAGGDSDTTSNTNTTASAQPTPTQICRLVDCTEEGEQMCHSEAGGSGGGGGSCPGGRPHANNNDGSFSDEEMDGCASDQSDNETTNDDDWHSHREQIQQQCSSLMAQTPDTVINNKSSKQIYKAVAREWGMTCQMSEQCRCIDCQSNYFDCEYEENEQHKSDGGLGAGAPMFISEVMHGTACNIL